jgi:hypothetical protein
MAGYMVTVRVNHLSPIQRRRAGREIKAVLREHPGLVRRSGRLSRSSFVRIDDRDGLMFCGATAPYASILSEGRGRLKRRYDYIYETVRETVGSRYIQSFGPL